MSIYIKVVRNILVFKFNFLCEFILVSFYLDLITLIHIQPQYFYLDSYFSSCYTYIILFYSTNVGSYRLKVHIYCVIQKNKLFNVLKITYSSFKSVTQIFFELQLSKTQPLCSTAPSAYLKTRFSQNCIRLSACSVHRSSHNGIPFFF